MAKKERQRKKEKEKKCTCAPGEHIEKIEYPKVSKDEWHPKGRIKKMEEIPHAADTFEVAAAEHDYNKGDITKGKQLSRGPDDSQKIWAVCKIKCCGYRREIDQAPSSDDIVEAKNRKKSFSGTDQQKNNEQFVKMGKKVTYKIPESQYWGKGGESEKVKSLIDKGFKVVGVPF